MEALPQGTVVSDGASGYRVLRTIGRWGPVMNLPVYEAVILPETDNTPHAVIKVVHPNNGMLAMDEMFKVYTPFLPLSILPFKRHFSAEVNGVQYTCIVLTSYPQVTSIRSLMASNSSLTGGLRLSCIATVLQRVVQALIDLPKGLLSTNVEAVHTQITAASVFFEHQKSRIKLAYAASAYQPTPPVLIQGEAPIDRMSIWARAPEVDEVVENDEVVSYIYNSKKSDIWMIGILALELAYGRIPVTDRQEILSIAGFVRNTRALPNTWEQLRASAAGGEMVNDSIGRFPTALGHLVGWCLADEPWRRPTLYMLRNHHFLDSSVDMLMFSLLVVNHSNAAPAA